MNPPRATTLAQRHGWSADPAAVGSTETPACIEVYPHPAMIGLFTLGRILKYKGGPLTTRRAAFVGFSTTRSRSNALTFSQLHAGQRSDAPSAAHRVRST